MHLTPTEAIGYLQALVPLVADVDDRDLFVLPAFPSLFVARDLLTGTNVAWGAQDVHPEDEGPFTGDVSAPMLADLGARFVEVGHPERRRQHGETEELIAAKVGAVLRWRMAPVVCVGEDRRAGPDAAADEVSGQLDRLLGAIAPAALADVVVAYEPLWAIGIDGVAAAPGEVSVVHAAIHRWFHARSGRTGQGDGARARVIYGGSVDAEGAEALLAAPGVDGLFVGRASLDPVRFAAIAHVPVGPPAPGMVRARR